MYLSIAFNNKGYNDFFLFLFAHNTRSKQNDSFRANYLFNQAIIQSTAVINQPKGNALNLKNMNVSLVVVHCALRYIVHCSAIYIRDISAVNKKGRYRRKLVYFIKLC